MVRLFGLAVEKIGPDQSCGKYRERKHYAAHNDCNFRRHPVSPSFVRQALSRPPQFALMWIKAGRDKRAFHNYSSRAGRQRGDSFHDGTCRNRGGFGHKFARVSACDATSPNIQAMT
jgi:hypothetical protein